ncbi:glycoside hydrolase family 88 protein [Glaciecola siphonariae]|uniref:Glycoside hydrolase family 88 protein n=1 Tax=Glaciecola siphonariae TaxID=521012 RepID=A0ABV9M0R6_9ALTE
MQLKPFATCLFSAVFVFACTSEAPQKDSTSASTSGSAAVLQEPIAETADLSQGIGDTNIAFCSALLDKAENQLDGFRKHYTDPSNIPRSYSTTVRYATPDDWTSGFVAGSFWYMYEHTQDESWLASAQEWTHALEQQQFNEGTHDLGFMMYNSYGNALRLTDKTDYVPIIIQTANSLMTRYNPTVGATRSWDFGDWEFPVIIDNMMNLELLFEATKLSGDAVFKEAAISHATVTMNNHFRPDYSSYHLVDYSTETGDAIHKQTYQGIADDSDWARGQGWGAYGYTMMYRYTQDQRFLTLAQNITEFYLNHPNMPDDLVPYFDFDAIDDETVENYRDSSTAALMASALLELASYVNEADAARYRLAAINMLKSLSTPEYLAVQGENAHFLLKQATGNYPGGYELSAAINYADYYYLEALVRCKNGG